MSLQEPAEENAPVQPKREPQRWWPDSTMETDLDEDHEQDQSEVLQTKFQDNGMELVRVEISKSRKRIKIEGWRKAPPAGDILMRWNIETQKPFEEKLPELNSAPLAADVAGTPAPTKEKKP